MLFDGVETFDKVSSVMSDLGVLVLEIRLVSIGRETFLFPLVLLAISVRLNGLLLRVGVTWLDDRLLFRVDVVLVGGVLRAVGCLAGVLRIGTELREIGERLRGGGEALA